MKECRYCLQGGGHMISPCHCKGHVEWVHVRCWTQWQIQKKNTHCEICHSKYYFPNKLIIEYICRLIFLLGSYYYTFGHILMNDGILNAVFSHIIIYMASKYTFTLPPLEIWHCIFAWHCIYICVDLIYFMRIRNVAIHILIMFTYYNIQKNRTIKDVLF